VLFKNLEKRLRDPKVVEVLTHAELPVDSKIDFQNKDNVEALFKRLEPLKIGAVMKADELHEAWSVSYFDSTNAERNIGIEMASQPEYRRMRALAKTISKYNQPPFVVAKDERKETRNIWNELLAYLREEGMKDANVQRYKGLGEMNAEQLWETTMNPEKRSLLRVDLQDVVEADLIFSTLMGEDVENRRRFIETNALDVRNLDI